MSLAPLLLGLSIFCAYGVWTVVPIVHIYFVHRVSGLPIFCAYSIVSGLFCAYSI